MVGGKTAAEDIVEAGNAARGAFLLGNLEREGSRKTHAGLGYGCAGIKWLMLIATPPPTL